VGQVKVVVDKSRVDGSQVRLAEVEVGDETGVVSLRARDDQIDLLQELSEKHGTVVLRNCTLELFQGKHIRLAVTKWGKMCSYPDQIASTPPPPSMINFDRNFSLIDLSVIASELAGGEETNYSLHYSSPDSNTPSPSSAPRTPQYGTNPYGRHNKGGRRPPTFSKTGGSVPGYTGHYKEHQRLQHAMPAYYHVGGMQSYAEVSPYFYGHGQPDRFETSPHQLLFQPQQFQPHQQRQLHHMYQSHGEQQRQSIPHSPMTTPARSYSFGSSMGLASDAHAGVYAVSIPSPTSRLGARSTPPSPGMNPKAVIFDPVHD
jgi:hypothetical protein